MPSQSPLLERLRWIGIRYARAEQRLLFASLLVSPFVSPLHPMPTSMTSARWSCRAAQPCVGLLAIRALEGYCMTPVPFPRSRWVPDPKEKDFFEPMQQAFIQKDVPDGVGSNLF